jgi:hypothetical protein
MCVIKIYDKESFLTRSHLPSCSTDRILVVATGTTIEVYHG